MKLCFALLSFLIFHLAALAGEIPIVTGHPQSQIAHPGTNVLFSVVSPNATYFQWRFNGMDILGATNASLQITNVQTTNTGYYLALASNNQGCVPTEMAYLSVVSSNFPATVPLSNIGRSQALSQFDGQPINNGTAWSIAGPELDQMQRVGPPAQVSNGYFQGLNRSLPTAIPGQQVYYRVDIAYQGSFGTYTQHSTVVKIVAGGPAPLPPPQGPNVQFPLWPEWPEPWLISNPSTNQIRLPGETIPFTIHYLAYRDFGEPRVQWRKDGKVIPGATNFVQTSGGFEGGSYRTILNITNSQLSDAGIYDVMVLGNNWFIAPKLVVAFQTASRSGTFILPRISGSNFISEFYGLAGRNYVVQRSSDLVAWSNLMTISNLTGIVMLTNPPGSQNGQFYRSLLLP